LITQHPLPVATDEELADANASQFELLALQQPEIPGPETESQRHDDDDLGSRGSLVYGDVQKSEAKIASAEGPPLSTSSEADRHGRLTYESLHPKFRDTPFASLSKKARTVTRRCEKLSYTTHELSVLRDQANYERQYFCDQQRFFRDSCGQFLHELKAVMTMTGPEPTFAHLYSLYDQVSADYDAVDAATAKCSNLDDRIGRVETQVVDKQQSLARGARSLVTAISKADLRESQSTSRAPTSQGVRSHTSSARHPKIPSLVLRYFELEAQKKVLDERGANVQKVYEDARSYRALRADQGETLIPTDEVLFAEYIKEQQEAEEAYSETLQQANDAKATCLDNKLNPDDFRRPPSVAELQPSPTPEAADAPQMPDTPSTLALGISVMEPSAMPLLAIASTHELSTLLTNDLDHPRGDLNSSQRERRDSRAAASRVTDWIENVPTGPFEPVESVEVKARTHRPRTVSLHSSSLQKLSLKNSAHLNSVASLSLTAPKPASKGAWFQQAFPTLFIGSTSEKRRFSDSFLDTVRSQQLSLQDFTRSLSTASGERTDRTADNADFS